MRLVDATGEAGRLRLTWLGQGGWLIRSAPATVVIDPYLSDSLARKYEGTIYPHVRLHPAPVRADELDDVDLVLCSHRHTDHMDPETLLGITTASPESVVVVPAAWRAHAISMGLESARVIGASEGAPLEWAGVRVDPVLAAHESLERDSEGNSLFLGYVLTVDGVRVYHSGDCIPYAGQAEELRGLGVDVAILPVNGRDATRAQNGVPGNFHPEEAVALAKDIGARVMVASHFGLFDFNTVDQARLDDAVRTMTPGVSFVQPAPGRSYEVNDHD
jgi:L-ascorbate metabolism protein UlaG (beta-lactamase superfamily)